MNVNLKEAIQFLERTPTTLKSMLEGLPAEWLKTKEGEDTWNATEVVRHMVEAEKNNWIPRLEFLLEKGAEEPFPPFDRFSHLALTNQTLTESLDELEEWRNRNLLKLPTLVSTEEQLEEEGLHPELGRVKVRELLSTWVVHDLTHIAQITRVLAEYYRKDVGPWEQYLGVLTSQNPKG